MSRLFAIAFISLFSFTSVATTAAEAVASIYGWANCINKKLGKRVRKPNTPSTQACIQILKENCSEGEIAQVGSYYSCYHNACQKSGTLDEIEEARKECKLESITVECFSSLLDCNTQGA